MGKLIKTAGTFFIVLLASYAVADTLEMADGTIIEGDFVGSSNGIIMFNTGDSIEAYLESQVIGIFLSEGVATAQAMAAAPSQPAVSVPAGTRLVIRMIDTIDSKRHGAGHKFRGQLEGALVVDGVTMAPRGTFLYGTVLAASGSGRAFGKAQLALEFTDIMVDDQLFPIATDALAAQTEGQGKKTVGRTARSAVLGGLIGGSSGAKTGAKIGVGASILTSGDSIYIPAGTLLETALRVPLSLD
jgi:hypothetical protein